LKKPKPVHVGRIHARAVRGPDEQGRWWWRAEVREGGKRPTVWRGWATVDGVADELAHVLTETGGRPTATLPSPDEVVTVKDLLEVWQGDRETRNETGQLADESLASSRTACKRMIAAIGSVRVDRLDLIAIDRYVASSLRVRAARTVRLDVVYLRGAWTWARERGLVPDRDLPRRPVSIPRTPTVRPTPEQLGKIVARLEAEAPPWVSVMVRVLAETGCRRGELAGLRWRDVDLEGGWLQVVGKTGPRTVALSSTAVSDLTTWLDEREAQDPALVHADRLVWGVARKTAGVETAKFLKDAREALGLPRITPQTLRRLAVDRLYRSGAEVGTAATALGHSAETALRAYRQASADDIRAAVDILEPVVPARAPKVVSIRTTLRTREAHKSAKGDGQA
jgi:integrase